MEDINENVIDSGLANNQIAITSGTISDFNTIRRWGNFLAIMGFIGIGFLVIGGIAVTVLLSSVSSIYTNGNPIMGYIGLIYIVIAVIYLFPVIHLYRFSSNMKRAILGNDNNSFSLSIANLRKLFAFIGIMTIVLISLYVLIILTVAITAAARH